MNADQLPNLDTFSKAAELSSFSAAARALGLSQAAVSQRVQALEKALGTPVFKRQGGRVLLTEAGQKLYEYAQRILALHREARGTITGHASPAAGELLLAGANTYRGTTFVNQGVMTVASGQALGATGSGEATRRAVAGAGERRPVDDDRIGHLPEAREGVAHDLDVLAAPHDAGDPAQLARYVLDRENQTGEQKDQQKSSERDRLNGGRLAADSGADQDQNVRV